MKLARLIFEGLLAWLLISMIAGLLWAALMGGKE